MLSVEYNDNLELVSSQDILKLVYNIYPQFIYLEDLLMFGKYRYTNDAIVEYLSYHPLFKKIFKDNFVEVYEDASFDYDYGSISSTHVCYAHIGYAYRTKELEKFIRETEDDYLWD